MKSPNSNIRVAAFRLVLIGSLLLAAQSTPAAGIIIERSFPWETGASSVERFVDELPLSSYDSGYKRYFRSPEGRKFGVEKTLIIQVVRFSSPDQFPNLVDATDIAPLVREQADLSALTQSFPLARAQIAGQLSVIADQLTKFNSGWRKLDRRWLTPQQYKDYKDEQARQVAAQKAAEEKRAAEARDAEQKRAGELRAAQERRIAEERAEAERQRAKEEAAAARARELEGRRKAEEAERQAQIRAKFNELELAKKNAVQELRHAQAELKDACAQVEQVEMAASREFENARKLRVAGQVFVATQGGQNVKFGALEVRLYSRKPVELLVSSCHSYLGFARKERATWERLDTEQKSLTDDLKSNDAEDADVFPLATWARSGAPYLSLLPKPLATAETDADGQFQLDVPLYGEYVIAAMASRNVISDVERYYWVVAVTETMKKKKRVLLSNNNLSTSGSRDSLIATADAGPSDIPDR